MLRSGFDFFCRVKTLRYLMPFFTPSGHEIAALSSGLNA